ncbi:MAG TPA: ABC transporter permease [Vicinamibacterales bacterium]|nr:ABC transporter permease [Vicinamibacterales bacterium]
MASVIADLRYAARELRRRPGFAVTAVLSLALGIGATSAVFSVIYGVLINPFPYVGSERMMQISLIDNAGRFRSPGLSGSQMDQLRQARTVESVVAEDGWNLTTTDGDIPEDVVASYIAPNAPNHWGVPAIMGRWLVPADAPPGQDPARVVVLGYQFWQRYYAGDADVIGRMLQLVRKDYQIVGVMPPRYRWREADVYLPLKVRFDPHIYYGATLKIRPGVPTAQANAELQPILERFAKQSPGRYPDAFRVNLRSIVELYARPMGPRLYLLLGAVTSLLLVGCANVSILLLVRGAHRQQELAVRAALGAGRSRIVRQLLTEAMVIAVAGAVLGIAIAWKGLALIVAWIPTNSFAAESVIEMNLAVLLFSTALAVVTAIAFGVWPALQLSRPELGRVAQTGARRVIGSAQGRRVHRVMIATQVALTLLMLTAAGAAGKGFLRLVHADLGYDPTNTMSLPIPVHDGTYPTWKERSEYFERLRAAVAAMPQVESAGISTNATPPANGGDNTLEILGSSAREKPIARTNYVSAEYFSLLHIPVAQGRLWTRDETARGAALAVINQTMARQYWPNDDAIGRQFRVATLTNEPPYSPAASGSDGWIQIIGIVADARNDGLRNPIKPAFYVPFTLKLRMFTQILVRARVPPLSILRDVKAELVRVDREQQVMRVRDLSQWITNLPEYAQQRLVARLFAIFSILALALAAVGLYSVVSYGVATRTNEFGIRMALGARARDVVRMVLSGMFWNVGAGLVAGVLLCLAFDKLASYWVTETARDPLILSAVTVLLLTAAIIACLGPARRAAAIDPMHALRLE